VKEAVSLGTQSEYAAFDEEKLNQGSDAKYDVNEDRGGGIAKRIVRNVLRGAVGAVGAVGAGAAATMGQTSDGKNPAHNGAANQEALDRECKQCGQTKTTV